MEAFGTITRIPIETMNHCAAPASIVQLAKASPGRTENASFAANGFLSADSRGPRHGLPKTIAPFGRAMWTPVGGRFCVGSDQKPGIVGHIATRLPGATIHAIKWVIICASWYQARNA
jgi:hypothetical protein